MGFFDKIKKIGIFSGFSKLDDSFYDELEETLILADMGMDTTLKAVEELRRGPRADRLKEWRRPLLLKDILAENADGGEPEPQSHTSPSVVLFIGGQRRGQDHHHRQAGLPAEGPGQKVLLAAADTFRPPPPTSWRSGLSGPGWRSSSSTRGPTRPPWCLTPWPPPRPAGPTWC